MPDHHHFHTFTFLSSLSFSSQSFQHFPPTPSQPPLFHSFIFHLHYFYSDYFSFIFSTLLSFTVPCCSLDFKSYNLQSFASSILDWIRFAFTASSLCLSRYTKAKWESAKSHASWLQKEREREKISSWRYSPLSSSNYCLASSLRFFASIHFISHLILMPNLFSWSIFCLLSSSLSPSSFSLLM